MNVRNLWSNQRGSITIEFVGIAIALIAFIYFVSDLMLRQSVIGRLDRTSYSVASIIRERTQLFNERETLTQSDVDSALQLAQKMLVDMDPGLDVKKVGLRVEELHFTPLRDKNDTSKRVQTYRQWDARSSVNHCTQPKPLSQMQDLAPRSGTPRWVPLYQVTVCLPTISWYTRFTTGNWTKPMMTSFAIVMAR